MAPPAPTDPSTTKWYGAYQQVLATGHYGHIVAKPGDVLPIPGIKAVIVSSNGELLNHPLQGAGQPNAYCKESETRPADQTDNSRSVGTLFTFGKLRILDLGDLTWDKEMQLMCPINKIGKVDILVVSHHGLFQSSSPALVDAIAPRVAIMNNGAKKGGSPPTFETLAKAPGLETYGSSISRTRPLPTTAQRNTSRTRRGRTPQLSEADGQSQRQVHHIQLAHRGDQGLRGTLRLAWNFLQAPEQKDVCQNPDAEIDSSHPKGPAEGMAGGDQIAGHDGRRNA